MTQIKNVDLQISSNSNCLHYCARDKIPRPEYRSPNTKKTYTFHSSARNKLYTSDMLVEGCWDALDFGDEGSDQPFFHNCKLSQRRKTPAVKVPEAGAFSFSWAQSQPKAGGAFSFSGTNLRQKKVGSLSTDLLQPLLHLLSPHGHAAEVSEIPNPRLFVFLPATTSTRK